MLYEFLPEGTFNKKFGDFKKCEGEWKDISEEEIKKLLTASLNVIKQTGSQYRPYLEWENAESLFKEGKGIRTLYGFIREKNNYPKCPLCADSITHEPAALSRKDNETKLCPECARNEAIEDFLNIRG